LGVTSNQVKVDWITWKERNMEKKKWHGDPGECNICQIPFQNAFSDVRTSSGQWGNICDECLPVMVFDPKNCYGTGKGQRYERQGNDWVKTKG
jgi:hypothetical protein